jgi:hypothetical protein
MQLTVLHHEFVGQQQVAPLPGLLVPLVGLTPPLQQLVVLVAAREFLEP